MIYCDNYNNGMCDINPDESLLVGKMRTPSEGCKFAHLEGRLLERAMEACDKKGYR